MSTHIGDTWRAAGLFPIAMAVQCTDSITPGPGRIRDFRHRLLDQPTQEAVALFEQQQRGLATNMVGPLTADQLERLVIDPGLRHLEVHPDAAKTALGLCDWVIAQKPPEKATLSDEEITDLAATAVREGVDEFRSSPDGGWLADALLRKT